jgi:uncharacterized protein (DUF433 family)
MSTEYAHIILDDSGTPGILGTSMSVAELAAEHLGYGWSAADLHGQHPDLTLGQIYSALAYYYDHQEAINQDVRRRIQEAQLAHDSDDDSLLRKRLKSMGVL